MMLKFIISLPKSSALCPSKSKTTTDSESHAICPRDSCTCTRANDTTPTTKTTGKRKSTQFYIDLGQKAFNSTTRCKRCQMVYIADDCDDKESHKKFCAQSNKLPKIGTVNELKLVGSFDSYTVFKACHRDLQKNKSIQETLNMITLELGNSHDMVNQDDIIYICTHQHSVVGLMVCEEVAIDRRVLVCFNSMTPVRNSNYDRVCDSNKNRKIRNQKEKCCSSTACIEHAQKTKGRNCGDNENSPPVSANLQPMKYPLSDCASSKSSLTAPKIMLGVRIMWVHADYRRSKVAHSILDIIRRSFVYGRVLSVDEVSFSELTEDGYRFASFYCNRSSIWTY